MMLKIRLSLKLIINKDHKDQLSEKGIFDKTSKAFEIFRNDNDGINCLKDPRSAN